MKVVISVALDALGTAPKKLKQQLSDIGSDIAVGIGTKVSEIENYYLIFWTDFSARKYS